MEDSMRKLIFALVICLSAVTAFAGHVDTYGIGSKGTSMGGAMTAGTDDPFSIYYNPAAITRIKKPTFSIGSHFINPAIKIDRYNVDESSPLGVPVADLSGSDIKDQSPWLIVPHMAYVQPITEKVSFGVAFYVPYGLELDWSRNPGENPAAYNTYHSWYIREVITPTIAYKVNDKLSLGLGVSIGRTEAGSERLRYVPAFMKNPAVWQAAGYDAASAAGAAAAYTELDGAQYITEMTDDFNYSFNIGVLYEATDKLSLGFTYRSRSNSDLEGTTKVNPTLAIWQNQKIDASTSIETPDQFQFGVQYIVTPKWKVSADLTRTLWSSIDSYTVDFSEPFMATPGLSAGAPEEYYKRNWKDTWQYRFGTEYKINEMFAVRGGYYYDPSVVPSDTYDVQWPDADKHVFSAGLGINFGKIKVDTVVQYIKIESVDINSGESENLDGSYTRPGIHEGLTSAEASGHLWGYGVTVSYEF